MFPALPIVKLHLAILIIEQTVKYVYVWYYLMDVTMLEQVPVAPRPESTPEISLPLTFIDLFWLHMDPVHRLIFYQHPISKTHFVETIIPTIKNSLSLTLQHYTPLAGRVVVSPDNQSPPEIRYAHGDTVPLVIAECNSGEGDFDFDRLTSDKARNCTEFHRLVPSLPPTSRSPDGSVIIPVFALQVTLFPDAGICIGVTNHHAIGDASSMFGFMKAWTLFSSHGEESKLPVSLPAELKPYYDRTVIRDRKGLGKLFWDNMKKLKIEDTQAHLLPSITDKVRSTFVVTRADIQKLKNQVVSRRPNLVHVSSFTVICSHVWICLVKSRNEKNIDNNDDEDYDYFVCPADCRARLDPPIPKNYFGNCVTGCFGRAKTKQLAGEEGFVDAAAVIGESIRSQLYNKEDDGPFAGAEDWLTVSEMKPDRCLSVSGSPKFDYYELDFGWGKPKKFEVPSIDINGAMSFSTSKDYEGGLEIGLSLPISQMDTFTKLFMQGLKDI